MGKKKSKNTKKVETQKKDHKVEKRNKQKKERAAALAGKSQPKNSGSKSNNVNKHVDKHQDKLAGKEEITQKQRKTQHKARNNPVDIASDVSDDDSDASIGNTRKRQRDEENVESGHSKKTKKTKPVASESSLTFKSLEGSENPFLDVYRSTQKDMPADIDRMMDPSYDGLRRAELLEMEPEELAATYAWAIPDERALRICTEFGPIVEVGAGLGYWARLLREKGVDVEAYDIQVPASPTDAWTEVRKGGPDVLKHKKNKKRALFLCYPDDFERSEESMALQCLSHFTGDTIIHVGEVFGQTICRPGAWGRSTADTFQIELANTFHRILQVPLPCWRSAMDTLTVWRRTRTCVVRAQDSDDDEPEEMMFAYIPPNEVLQLTMSCAATAHLLQK